ncbi:MAG: peptidoglycan-associated lipoprotein Pal [Rickettsiales bacterium]|nr:MAG: peptidoglycan-associated lipoprotein Pal [Rickettsiales bacterium]
MKKKILLLCLVLGLIVSCADENAPATNLSNLSDSSNLSDLSEADLRVYFDYDKYTLQTKDPVKANKNFATLDAQATLLRRNNSVKVTIEGNCDERGTREYNMALGAKRASAAKAYLVKKGVRSSQIKTTSNGKDKPSVDGHNEDAWSVNRNATTVIR